MISYIHKYIWTLTTAAADCGFKSLIDSNGGKGIRTPIRLVPRTAVFKGKNKHHSKQLPAAKRNKDAGFRSSVWRRYANCCFLFAHISSTQSNGQKPKLIAKIFATSVCAVALCWNF